MNIDKAMSETRRYFVMAWNHDAFTVGTRRTDVSSPPLGLGTFKTRAAAQAACDRLNLRAVLEAIREPSHAMIDAIGVGDVVTDANRWRAMIDALLERL